MLIRMNGWMCCIPSIKLARFQVVYLVRMNRSPSATSMIGLVTSWWSLGMGLGKVALCVRAHACITSVRVCVHAFIDAFSCEQCLLPVQSSSAAVHLTAIRLCCSRTTCHTSTSRSVRSRISRPSWMGTALSSSQSVVILLSHPP